MISIRDMLLREHSKRQTMAVVHFVGNNKSRFRELLDIFSEADYRLTQRAAWSLMYVGIGQPELIKPHFKYLLSLLDAPLHVSVRRNVLRILQDYPIPARFMGALTEKCFYYLAEKDESIAVKVFSMSVLANICKSEPGLAYELRLTVENILQHDHRPAIVSRGTRTLKQLRKLDQAAFGS